MVSIHEGLQSVLFVRSVSTDPLNPLCIRNKMQRVSDNLLQFIRINLSLLWISFGYDSTSWSVGVAIWLFPSRKQSLPQLVQQTSWPKGHYPRRQCFQWKLFERNKQKSSSQRSDEPNEELYSNFLPNSFLFWTLLVFFQFRFIFFFGKTMPSCTHSSWWSSASAFTHNISSPCHWEHPLLLSRKSIDSETIVSDLKLGNWYN